MTATCTSPPDGDERLYEHLAELLDTRDRTGRSTAVTERMLEPEIASGLQAYFDAVQVVNRFTAGLTVPAAHPAVLPMPERIGDYEFLSEIGRGGAAVVYKARQSRLNRFVAVKMLHGGRSGSLHDVERLRFEAEAVAQLEHPGVVPIFEIGEHEGRPYFSMPLYEYGSLSGRLQEFIARPRRAAELLAEIALAVQYAHERGILHRDLKPSNILLDAGGRPHVADFGLAKRLTGDRELTRTGELIGTPAYMAPERVAGSAWAGPTTIATDVYGLGAILYALLTGRPPFEEDTPVETLLAVGTTDVVPPAAANPAVDRDLETICLRCLEKHPGARYATAADLATDLRHWLNGEPITARQQGRIERLKRWCRRHPVQASVAIAAVVLLFIGGIGLTAGYVVINAAYQDAEVHRKEAETHAALLNQRLYASQMSLGHRHFERRELTELRHVVDGFRGLPDMRGFEWHWLDRHARAMPREVARFAGHWHFLYGGAFSPDGGTAATCGADGTIRLWNVATGAELQKFENGAGLTPAGVPYDENRVLFSPDGALLASVGEDGGVRLWTLANGSMRSLAPVRSGEALVADFSRDGQQLAVGWTDGYVQVWEVASGALRNQLSADVYSIQGVTFLPEGDRLVTVGRAGVIRIWNLSDGSIWRALSADGDTRCLAVSPDGALIATGSHTTDEVVTWDAQNDRRGQALPAGDGVRTLAFSHDGRWLAAAGNDGYIRLWSVADYTLHKFFRAHPTTIWDVSFSPDDQQLLTVSSDMTACVSHLATDAPAVDQRLVLEPVRQLRFSPDGGQLAVVTAHGQISLCSASHPDQHVILPVPASYRSRPVFRHDGRQLVFVDFDGAIRCWDTAAGQLLPIDRSWPHATSTDLVQRQLTQLALLTGDKLVVNTYEGDLIIESDRGWQTIRRPDLSDHPRLLAVTADGRGLVMRRDAPPRVELWMIDGSAIADRRHIADPSEIAAVSADGRRLAIGRIDGTIQVVDLTDPDSQTILVGHHANVLSIDFSADSRTIASVGQDGTSRLWNVATGAELFVIEAGEGPLYAVAFSPDGSALAVGGDPHQKGATLSILRTK